LALCSNSGQTSLLYIR